MKLYPKYHWFSIIIVTGLFVYALISYQQDSFLVKKAKLETYTIATVHCRTSGSTVWIESKGKSYSVKVGEAECLTYAAGGKINVFYNQQYDYFFHSTSNLNMEWVRLIFMGSLLFLFLLPWKLITKKFKKYSNN